MEYNATEHQFTMFSNSCRYTLHKDCKQTITKIYSLVELGRREKCGTIDFS